MMTFRPVPPKSCGIVAALVAIAAAGFVSDSAHAQLPTTVQLPSFSSFSYRGTVVVPDSGGAYLGGVNRSATGLNRRGLSRGFGSSLGRSGASVHATIIDHREIDRRLLGTSKKEFIAAGRTNVQDLRQAGQRTNRTNVQDRKRRTVSPTEEGKELVRYARKLYREGKKGDAFDTYRMAIKILPTGLRELAIKEFERTFGAAATQAARMTALR